MGIRHNPKFTCAPPTRPGRIYDTQPNNFDLLRADLGRFWLVWIAAYTAIVIKASVLVLGWLIAWVQA